MDQIGEYVYEWDEDKRQRTLLDRSVDFADMAFFDWDAALTGTDIRRDHGEMRFSSIGFIKERLHVCIWCWLGDAIRVISLRKANQDEQERYRKVIYR